MSASRSVLSPGSAAATARNADLSAEPHQAPVLIDEEITVTTRRIGCDGGGGALGHPRVWLNLGEDGRITCPYCSRRYVLAGAAPAGH